MAFAGRLRQLKSNVYHSHSFRATLKLSLRQKLCLVRAMVSMLCALVHVHLDFGLLYYFEESKWLVSNESMQTGIRWLVETLV